MNTYDFKTNDDRDKWVSKFQKTITEISESYNAPELHKFIKLATSEKQATISTRGTYVTGSNLEGAIREVLAAWRRG